MNLTHIFQWSYWFLPPVPFQGGIKIATILISLAIIVIGIGLKIVASRRHEKVMKKVYHRFGNVALFLGILYGIWIFFRQEEVPIFSGRFWLLIVIIITLWWLYKVIYYLQKRVPEIKRQNEERMKKEKYLPKRS